MKEYLIEGGHSLKGEIEISGNKNSALPCIAACALTADTVILKNIPRIEDVKVMCSIIEHLGATVVWDYPQKTLSICAKHLHTTRVPVNLAQKIRASFLFAGPLVTRKREVFMPPPGGDVIGRRRLDTHIVALQKMGATCEINHTVHFKAPHLLAGATIFLDEASVTATENTIMAAVCAKGVTRIENAACEPHVQDLCHMLVSMGAVISGIGSNVLVIEGVAKMHGTTFTIGPDFMEIGSFIGLAAATKSEIYIKNIARLNLDMIKVNFNKLGVHWQKQGADIYINARNTPVIKNDIGGAIARIDDAPWPGFPADLVSIALVVATQAQGTILIHEKLYESRLFFVDKLISMGAQIILCDPHRAVVQGATQLRAACLTSPDVRAGMAMVIAALCARGISTIQNVHQIQRGYENMISRLQRIGARIEEQ